MKFLINHEQKMFASVAGYRSMGVWIYYTSAIIGACVGLEILRIYATNSHVAISPIIFALTILAFGLCSFAIVDSIIRIDNGNTAAKRAVYNCVAIIVAMILGAVGSVVVVLAVVAFILLKIIFAIITGEVTWRSKTKSTSDDTPRVIHGDDGEINYITPDNDDDTYTTQSNRRIRRDGSYDD